MEEELLSAPAVAPSATPDSILKILSGMAPRDPAATNPATTAAMARSRDAITRTLERQMARQEEPFSGINDVATAAITALASRHKTPFGTALAQLDNNRDAATVRTASTLGQQAQRESKGGVDPIKAANLVMRHIEQQSRNGDRDAREVDSFVKTLSANMEPASALRFQTSYGKAIADYVGQYGQNPDTRTIKMLVADYAARGGFQTKLPNLQVDAFGRPFNPSPYGQQAPAPGGGPPPGTVPNTGETPQLLSPYAAQQGQRNNTNPSGRGPMFTPAGPPGAAGPPGLPAAQGNWSSPQPPQAAPSQPPLTPSAQSQLNVKSIERQRSSAAFNQISDAALADAVAAGPNSMGTVGWLARTGGALVEQIGAAGFGPEYREVQSRYAPFLDNVVKLGAESAGVQAGILSMAYLYSKAMDESGIVNKNDLERALASLGAAQGSVEQLRTAVAALKRDVAIKNGVGQAPVNRLPGNAADLSKLSDDEVLRAIGAR